MKNDTIVGIITSIGQGAINVIRLSGDDSIQIVNKIFKGANLEKVKTHTVHYGHIYNNQDEIDEVLVSVFKNPRTYTKEDVVEISSHGGAFIVQKILDLLIEKGARLAEPGEFTKRAFLNGRIDLTKAEAVMDMINAKTDQSLKLANKGLNGKTYQTVTNFRNELLDLIAKIEVNIDYPEYDDAIVIENEIAKPIILNLIQKLEKIIEKANENRVYREGIKTAIIGKPNVGKSSLLNSLINEDKAIVTDISGTTRDIVEGTLIVGGLVLNLIDTAGIRETTDIVEKIGINKSKEMINNAELILLVLDGSTPLEKEDYELLNLTENKPRIIISNKSDLGSQKLEYNAIQVSALNKNGLDELETAIKSIFIKNKVSTYDDISISNTRHINLLKKTNQSLYDAIESIEMEMEIDMVEIDVKNAWLALGEITGETSNDLLLDELFSKFCLGK